MRKKIIIKTKDRKTYRETVDEPESPVNIEYAINCSSVNYSSAVLEALKKLELPIEEVLSVNYDPEYVEKYEPNQGANIKNTIKKYGV
jgi:hypothetical protein